MNNLATISPEQARQWADVEPLVHEPERLPYPIDALPDLLRDAVLEVQEHVQAPTALIASCALSAVSLAIQAHIDVARDEKLIGPSSLFMLSLGDSGERKSSVDGHFTRAIVEYEARVIEEKAPEIKQFSIDVQSHNAKRSGLLAKIKELAKAGKPTTTKDDELNELERHAPTPPKLPSLLMTDATQEALLYRLAKEWPSGGIFSDEGGAVFGGHGMGKDSVMRFLSTLNTAWGGGTQRVSRRTSESFSVTNSRLTMHIQVQGAALQEFMKSNGALARGSGFLARFLIADPVSTKSHRLYREPKGTSEALDRFNARIARILERHVPMNSCGELEPSLMRLSPEAKRVWVAYHDEVERSLAADGEFGSICDAASKSADNAVRLAALFAYLESETPATPISEKHMCSGVAVATWHLYETQRFFATVSLTQDEQDIHMINEWLITQCRKNATDRLTRREIQQYGPPPARDTDRRDRALSTLANVGRVSLEKIGKADMVLVNPALLAEVSS